MPTETFFNLREEKKARIEQAVFKVYTTMPYEKVSISAIVSEAGIPRGSFYQYFTDLDDLYIYFSTRTNKELVTKIYEEGIVNFWYGSGDRMNFQSIEYYMQKKENLIGKLKNDFILTIYQAPENLRNTICINNVVEWSGDMIRVKLREAFPHVSDKDLDFYTFLYSMGDLLEKKYLDWKRLPLEMAPEYSSRSMKLIFGDLSRLDEAEKAKGNK